jgi:molybdopterin converting factor small subunit
MTGALADADPKVRILLPYSLREHARGHEVVDVQAASLADAIAQLGGRFPGLAYRILDDQGRLRRYVLAFVNDEPVDPSSLDIVRLQEGDTVHILPSVAGG